MQMMSKKSRLLFLIFTLITFSGNSHAMDHTSREREEQEKWRQTWLSQSEQRWLSQHRVIRHGMVGGKRHMPFEYTDDLNQHQGLTSDYLHIISGLTLLAVLCEPKLYVAFSLCLLVEFAWLLVIMVRCMRLYFSVNAKINLSNNN